MKNTVKLLAILLALGMLLSLGACGFTAGAELDALLGSEPIQPGDFTSPLEYYRAVETRHAQKLLTLAMLNAQAASDKSFAQGELLLAVDQSVLDPYLLSMLTQAVGMDLSWFRSVSLGFLMGKDGDLAQENLTARVNGTDIATLEAVIDRANLFEYFTVPELSPTAVFLDPLQQSAEHSSLSRDELKAILSGELLTPEDAIDLIVRYYGVVMSSLEKVEAAEGTVSAGGIETAGSLVKVTIDGETMLKIAKAALGTARYDQKLEKLIFLGYRLSDEYSGDEAGFHADYDAQIQQYLENLENKDPADIDGAIVMTVFVDSTGEILGRSFEIISEDEPVAHFSYAAVLDGNTVGVEAGFDVHNTGSYTYNDTTNSWEEQVSVSFNGTADYAPLTGSITGNFLLSLYTLDDFNGDRDELAMDLFTLNLDGTLNETGFLGEAVLTPCDDLMNMLLEELDTAPQPVVDLVKSLTLAFVSRGENGVSDCALILRTNGKDLLSLGLTASEAAPFAITVPTDTVEPTVWAQSIGPASLNAILNNLIAAGVPTEVINAMTSG